MSFSSVAAEAPKSRAGATPPSARVVVAKDEEAIETFNPVPDRVRTLVRQGIVQLSGKTNATAAWRTYVSTQDIIGIKVFSSPGGTSGTRPAVAEAVIEALLAAGIPPWNIVIWDKHLESLRVAGFESVANRHGVRLAAAVDAGYDEKVFYETALVGHLVWGDLEFGRKGDGVGRKSYVSKLLTSDLTKVINITPMLNHNQTGVSGNLFGLAMASVDNVIRFESDSERMATAVPEIYAMEAIGDKVVLNIVDALICQYQGEQRGLLHYSSLLGELRFSTDPVALDVLSIAELDRQRKQAKAPEVKKDFSELYHNASLVELGIGDPRQIRIENVP